MNYFFNPFITLACWCTSVYDASPLEVTFILALHY